MNIGRFGEMKSAGSRFEPGDVLYGRLRPYLNKVWRAEFEGVASAEFIVFPHNPYIDGDFLKYLLHHSRFVHFASHLVSGDRPRVNMDQISGYELLLPPLAEQHRIAARIEETFGEIEAGEQELEKAREGLAAYRRAVLKAAVTGELTREWREKNAPNETGADLLASVLIRRRQQWQESQLRKFRSNGKKPPQNWQERYPEPDGFNGAEVAPVPRGWTWATVDQLTRGDRPCAYGVLQPGLDVHGGVPLIRVGDINDGRVNTNNLKRISPKIAAEFARTRLEGGELLITLVGTIGRTAVAPEGLAGANTARAVGVIPLNADIDPTWAEIWFRSPLKLNEMVGKAHEVARKTLNLEDVRAATVVVPPYSEQRRIIAAVEEQLSAMEQAEVTIDAEFCASRKLRQFFLAAAFSGNLVSQDSSDEPASVLLEKLKASTNNGPAPRGRRRGRAA